MLPVIWRLYFNKLTKLNIQFLNKQIMCDCVILWRTKAKVMQDGQCLKAFVKILFNIKWNCNFVKHGCPWQQQKVKIWQNFEVLRFDPTPSQAHVLSWKCGKTLGEFTVKIWWLYYLPNFKNCTLNVRGTELRTNNLIPRCSRPSRPLRPEA